MERQEIIIKGSPIQTVGGHIELGLLRLIKRTIGALVRLQFAIEHHMADRWPELLAAEDERTNWF